MVRQGYLDRIKSGAPGAIGSQAPNAPNKKRARGSLANDDENKDNFNWRWGPRAMVEFSEEGMVDFITGIMVEKHDLIEEVEEEDEEGTPGNAARYHQRKADEAAAMKKSILKAAMTQVDRP